MNSLPSSSCLFSSRRSQRPSNSRGFWLLLRNCLPMKTFPRLRNKKILVPTIWITSMCLMTPWLITIKVKNSRIEFKFTQFGETQAALRGIFLYIVVTIYLLPLVTMCILYGHVCHTLHKHKLPGIAINNHARTRAHATKRQVIHMSIAVVVAFALCWLPAHAYHMILAIDFSVRESLPYYFMLLCYWCGHANSVVNPWLLIYLKKKFRAAFKRMITYPLSRISFASKNNESVRSVTKLPIRDPIVQVREHYQFASSVWGLLLTLHRFYYIQVVTFASSLQVQLPAVEVFPSHQMS